MYVSLYCNRENGRFVQQKAHVTVDSLSYSTRNSICRTVDKLL